MAGGDGTVAKVARRLVKSRSKIPMSVLPLGTANNVARTLGFDISAEAVIAGLKKGKTSSFDVGIARGPWGKRYFFEGAGAGLFADYLSAPRKEKEKATKSKALELRQHLTELRRLLAQLSSARMADRTRRTGFFRALSALAGDEHCVGGTCARTRARCAVE